jgi:hypothetical protein
MTRLVLSGGAYQSRSVISGAQRCVNLYPESNPTESDPPVPVTHYPTPGLRLLGQSPNVGPVRCLYRATNGDLYVVIGFVVYYVDNQWQFTTIGTVNDLPTPVSMADNGTIIFIVDGTSSGWTIDMGSKAFNAFSDPAFFGADRVEYLDTFFAFNYPGTAQFYISGSLATTFDPLDIAAKTGAADRIATIIACHGELWVMGELTTEIWSNQGTPDFAFGRQQGAFIEHGCRAKYSVAKQDVSVFWLSQDKEGQGIVIRGSGYQVDRISTHAIEAYIQSYSRIDDAIGYCFQQQGHAFYVLTFPTADVTWAYELKSKQWHQLASADANGTLHRHRSNAGTFAYGVNVIGDWQNGALYALDPNVFTENGNPIIRIRSFPHLMKDGKRVSYNQFIADMEVGTLAGTSTEPVPTSTYSFSSAFSSGFDSPQGNVGRATAARAPLISMRYSDTRGASWSNPRTQSLGAAGQYKTSVQWRRLGMARDRVFELSWSAPIRTALNGAFIDAEPHSS